MRSIYKSIVAVLLIAFQVDCFAFGIWPAPQPYAIVRAHHNLVEDFSRFLQRDLPNLVYGPGPRQYSLPPHPSNHGLQFGPPPQTNSGFQRFSPPPQSNPGFQQFSQSPQLNPEFHQFSSSPQPNSGFQQFGPQQQPFIFGLPSTLSSQQFLGAQPTFGPSGPSGPSGSSGSSEFSHHQPAPFYGSAPSFIGSSLSPQYSDGVIPLPPRPAPPIFIPQSELQLPTSPAIGYLPTVTSSSAKPPKELSTSNPNAVASSTKTLTNSPSSIDSRFPSSSSSSVDSVPSANQPTTHTVSFVSLTSPQASSMSTTALPAITDTLVTSTLISTQNDSNLQTSTESANPLSTIEQLTVRTEAASTASDENIQSTSAATNEEITNNAV